MTHLRRVFAVGAAVAVTSYVAGCGTRGVDDPNLKEGVYSVTSDCPGAAATEGESKLKEASSLNDVEGDYDLENAVDYGMPSQRLDHGGPHKVVSRDEAGELTCMAMVFAHDATTALFACHDDGDIKCTVHLSRKDDLE